MSDEKKIKMQFIEELEQLRRQIAKFEKAETERNKAGKALRESFSSCVPLGIFLMNAEGQNIFINDRLQDILEMSNEEKKDFNWSRMVHPDDREGLLAEATRTGKGEEFSREFRIITRRDELKWVHMRTAAVLSEHGKQIGQVGAIEDITGRKRSEKALLYAAAKWRATFDAMPNLVMLLDRDYRILRANKALARALGISSPEIIGEQCFRCIRGNDTPCDPCAHAQAMKDGKEHTCEIYEPGLGGHFLVSAAPILDDNGNITGTVHVMRDITREVALQKQLLHSEKLATTGEFAAAIAHEVKNPIFAISSGIQILQDHLKLNGGTQKTLDTIFRETMRVDRLINHLLTYSAPQEMNLTSTQIKEIISEVVLLNSGLLQSRKIKIREKIPEDMAPVYVDKDKITQVLINLLQNAIDVSEEGDCIEIVCRIDVRNQRAVIMVKDEGPGIPEDQRSKVFDLFFSNKKGSSGMGLAISKRIVLDHGGDIRVESKKKGGTTMVVELPLRKDNA